jgi:phage terminase small subunit
MAGVPKRLTEKQLKFARLYVLNEGRMTATECAIEAGYTKDQEALGGSRNR